MTVKGGTSQACAACKYQRRKCSDKCLLAPYFPADDPQKFQNAHRLFGVSNMMKILNQVRDDQKRAAMDTIIYESNVRRLDPVHGCCGRIRDLCDELERCTDALYHLNTRIQILREQRQQQQLQLQQQFRRQNPPPPPPPPLPPLPLYNSYPYPSQQPLYRPSQPSMNGPYQQPFVGTSSQVMKKETKARHVQVDKKIPNSFRGHPDLHNNMNDWKDH